MKKNSNKILHIFMIIYLVMFGFERIVFADNVTCSSYGTVLEDLQNIFDYAKFIIPFLIIGLSSYDFIKAITSKEAKDINKAFNTLIKRLALALFFFFLPVLLNVLFKIVGINSNTCID